MLHAVITADIVNSTQLGKAAERQLLKTFETILASTKHAFYRGDSLQVYIKKPGHALRLVFLLRAAAQKTSQGGIHFDVKASIGIGPVQTPVSDLGAAKGKAFLLSGRSFDETIKGDRRLVIVSGHPIIDNGLEVLSEYADDIFGRLTPKQAAVIFELLQDRSQEQIAKQLKKSQPTVSKQVNAANWRRLQWLLVKFDQFINFI